MERGACCQSVEPEPVSPGARTSISSRHSNHQKKRRQAHQSAKAEEPERLTIHSLPQKALPLRPRAPSLASSRPFAERRQSVGDDGSSLIHTDQTETELLALTECHIFHPFCDKHRFALIFGLPLASSSPLLLFIDSRHQGNQTHLHQSRKDTYGSRILSVSRPTVIIIVTTDLTGAGCLSVLCPALSSARQLCLIPWGHTDDPTGPPRAYRCCCLRPTTHPASSSSPSPFPLRPLILCPLTCLPRLRPI